MNTLIPGAPLRSLSPTSNEYQRAEGASRAAKPARVARFTLDAPEHSGTIPGAIGDILPPGVALTSKLAVIFTLNQHRVTQCLSDDFEVFRKRDLSSEELLYLELDGTFLRYHQGAEKKEPILVATGYRIDGTRVLLHIGVGNGESYANWKGFLQEMVARGLREPLLIVTDGNPGVLKAIEEVFPQSLKQRCQKHRLENILGKAPKEIHDELKAEILESFHAKSYEQGLKKGREVITRYRQRFPSAMNGMEETLEACLQVLRLPEAHHKRLRTSNLLERTFGELKRRTKVIPHFFTEQAAIKLSFAVLLATASKWRGVRMDVFTIRRIEELRNEFLPKSTSEEPAA